MLDPKVQEALEKDLIIDITTTGRKTGDARRVEIWFHNLDGITLHRRPALARVPVLVCQYPQQPSIDLPSQRDYKSRPARPCYPHYRRRGKIQSLGADMR